MAASKEGWIWVVLGAPELSAFHYFDFNMESLCGCLVLLKPFTGEFEREINRNLKCITCQDKLDLINKEVKKNANKVH